MLYDKHLVFAEKNLVTITYGQGSSEFEVIKSSIEEKLYLTVLM